MHGAKDGTAADLATIAQMGLSPIHKTTTANRPKMGTTGSSTHITSILLLNIRGLLSLSNRTKIPFLRDLVACNQALCIALMETHQKPDIGNAEIHIPQYVVFWTDRKERSHGGVAMYIREDLTSQVLLSHSNSVCDTLIIHIRQLNVVICATYRPPDAPNHVGKFEDCLTKIEEVLDTLEQHISVLLMGDFNLPNVRWPEGLSLPGMTRYEQGQVNSLLNLANTLYMEQVVLQPTRAGNILDLCFTNNMDLIHNVKVTPTLLLDHNMVELTMYGPKEAMDMQPTRNSQNLSSLNFNKANWKQIEKEILKQNWPKCLSSPDIDMKLKQFMSVMQAICYKCVPERKATVHKNKIPRERKILMRRHTKVSNRLNKQIESSEKSRLKIQLLEIEKNLQLSHGKERADKEAWAIDNIKSNPRAFYKFAKETASVHCRIGPLLEKDGALTGNPKRISEILNDQFKSVFTPPLGHFQVSNPTDFFTTADIKAEAMMIDYIDIKEDDVIRAIDELNPNSATGPDGFPAILLKVCKRVLARPLQSLFQSFLASGKLPRKLKEGKICPIHKGGSRAEAKNYRPISLTSHISKVMERIVRRKLIAFLEENDLLPDTQHGFRPGRSCLTQLLQHYDWVLKQLLNHSNVEVIYLDFAKAFDKVDHGMICHKLRDLGIVGKLGEWLHDFLKDRSQVVVANGATSNDTQIVSGVPQGTVLGPLLFIMALSDMPSATQRATVTSYADDTKVSQVIQNPEDTMHLQCELDEIYKWAEKNNMQFNAEKFQALCYQHARLNAEPIKYTGPGGTAIPEAETVRDLGIYMSNNASFHVHVAKLSMKCRRLTGWILRTFRTRDQETMMVLWKTLVLSHFDYCSQLWSPTSVKLISELEAIQRSYTKKIASMQHISYWERLKRLRLYSLERRRERYAIIYIWKILEGIVPNFGIESYTNKRTGRHCIVPRTPNLPSRCRTRYCNSLGFRGPQLFNILPKDLRDLHAVDVGVFKTRLDLFLSGVPDEPTSRQEAQMRAAASNSLMHQMSIPEVKFVK